MRGLLLGALVSGLLGLNACRTGGTPPGAEVPSQVPSAEEPAQAPSAAVKPEAVAPPQILPQPMPAPVALPRDTQPVKPIAGFSLVGADECAPLAEGAVCIQRVDPLQAACARLKGEVHRCDDCRMLCSRSVVAKAATPAPK